MPQVEYTGLKESRGDAACFPAGAHGNIHTHDCDELSLVTPDWEKRYQQLSKGRFAGSLLFAYTRHLGVGRESWSPGIMVECTPPPGTAMIAIPLRYEAPMINQGTRIPDDAAVLQFAGEPIDFRTTAPFQAFVLNVDVDRLNEYAQIALGYSLNEVRRASLVRISHAQALRQQLHHFLASLEEAVVTNAEFLDDPSKLESFEEHILDMVLSSFDLPRDEKTLSRRCRIAVEAEGYIRGHLSDALSILDLCRQVAVPRRTLFLAFREHFGTSPKAYHKMLRLNALRQQLKKSRGRMTVTDVAIRLNFTHFGWLSQDYLEMFGEHPSETLALSGARKSGEFNGAVRGA